MPGGPAPRIWCPDEDSLLHQMVAEGATWSEIGRALGLDRRMCKGRHTALTAEPPDPPRPTRTRPCMRCGRSFQSEGAHNRLCDPCRDGAAGMAPLALIQHGHGGISIQDGGVSGLKVTDI